MQVSMSSSTRCDALRVSSQLETYMVEVLPWVTLSINAFDFWHAIGPSRLARLVKDLTGVAALQTYGTHLFCLWVAI